MPSLDPTEKKGAVDFGEAAGGGVGVRSGKGTLESESVCEPCVGHL